MHSKNALRAFGSGFGGSFVGGTIYMLVLTFLYPDGLDFGWLRVFCVSIALGGFETWRALRRCKRRSLPQPDGQPFRNSMRY